MDVADGRVVQVPAPDERHQRLEEGGAGRFVAGDHARLDQRRALPVLAVALVVELGGVAGQRQRVPRRVRSQAQIGAKDVAVLGLGLEQIDQPAREPDAERHRALRAAVGQAALVEQDDQVDVARVVELAAPCLPMPRTNTPQSRVADLLVGQRDLAALGGLQQQVAQAQLRRLVGQGGERRRHPLDRPQPHQVA